MYLYMYVCVCAYNNKKEDCIHLKKKIPLACEFHVYPWMKTDSAAELLHYNDLILSVDSDMEINTENCG